LGAAAGAALASLALALSGCGGGSAAATEKTDAKQVDTVAPRACPTELSRFADTLQRLRRRLVAGLTYDEYVGAVRALRSEYAAIPVEAVGPTCLLRAGTPSERAFDIYVEAANRWGECLSQPGCDGGDVEAPLQAEWHRAARQLATLRR
jgi:hypothetical protein